MTRAPWALAAGAALALAAHARADGDRIQQGGPSLGNAGAGAEATGEDPTTVWFNPAGMTRIGRPEGEIVVSYVGIGVQFRDRGSRDGTGAANRGGNGDGSADAVLPGLFAVVPTGERTRFGIGVNEPFGLGGDFGEHWAGRYYATKTELRTVNVNPSFAYRLDETWSFGAGLDLQQLDAKLENAIDFGSAAVAAFGAGPAAALGLSPQKDDGLSRLRGSSLGFGWNVGALVRIDDATRVGFHYRSQIDHRVDGRASFDVPAAAERLTLAGAFHDTGVRTDITIPEQIGLGGVRRIGEDWDLLASVDWTRFSRFEELNVHFDNPKQKDSVEHEGWNDTFRGSLGATYRLDPKWTLRAGVSFDQSVVGNKNRRPVMPDADRATIAFGVGWRLGDSTTLDLDYVHAWVGDGRIRLNDSSSKGTLDGTTRFGIDILSVSLTIGF